MVQKFTNGSKFHIRFKIRKKRFRKNKTGSKITIQFKISPYGSKFLKRFKNSQTVQNSTNGSNNKQNRFSCFKRDSLKSKKYRFHNQN